MSEYFLNFNGEKIFVILIGHAENKYYLYYPKGDTLVILDDKGNIEMKEIVEVIGEAPSGFKVAEVSEPWEKVKNRKVVWNIVNEEIEGDNVYVVVKNVKDYRIIENSSAPDRLKYYVFKDADPWEFKDWCCVLIVSTKDIDELPPSFKKVYFDKNKIEL
ncbi:hypothetical protein EWF20_13695 [Sulfolobus sp. S-194]|uniref:hypothetical protein n=1 Tax=Sulfolobus sp. S-194 TaxID=2512240 RepID=UPI001436F9B4|nr:hypothetical protein [Sulfolobus sp. S-194]QIW25083.1 hypothetical protein EWF20_13695 [Sulfolobus sp. S-194]